MKFENLQLNGNLLKAIEQEGYHTPTPIQIQAIPHVLSGRDLLGCAQTGTGKTAAFALPTLQRLLESPAYTPPTATDNGVFAAEPKTHRPSIAAHGTRNADRVRPGGPATLNGRPPATRRAIRALILAPTRELAAQIEESFQVYGRHSGLRQTVIYGGVGQGRQVLALREGVDILVATPGRLLDLMQQGYIRLSAVEVLILDEADQMLDMGFLPDLKRVVAHVPRERQTLMFSATMPPEIRRLADQWLRNPVSVQVAPVATPAALVEQSVYMVETRDKPRLLAQFLREQGTGRTLVFTRTKHGADKVVRCLEKAGVRAAAIHGNKSQNARLRVLAEFKSERPPVLVATDIAARGLDIDQIAHVVNYDLPNVPETYVHRIGRTGRAGAKGSAISLCSGEEREFLKQIERLTRVRVAIREYTLPPADPATDPPTPRRPAASGNRPNNQGQRRGTGRRSHDDRANRDTSTGERDRVSNGRRASNGRVTASRDSASRGDMGRGDMGRGETGRGGQSRVGENRSRVGESRNDARRTDNSRTEARPADARQSRTGPSTSQPSREHTGGSRERSQATREAQPWPQKPVSVNRWSW
jgi:ATP-dependent RNA helicase RhlE